MTEHKKANVSGQKQNRFVKPMFEAHVTTSKMPAGKIIPLLDELKGKGLNFEVDFFQRVINVDKEQGLSCLVRERGASFADSTPTGHDLRIPGAMLTIKSGNYEDIVKAVRLAAAVISMRTKDHFNFEIERFLSEKRQETTEVNMERDFPGFQIVHDAPLFESHIGWHGNSLPSNEHIVRGLMEHTGFSPHQIVDFSAGVDTVIVDRVVTFYQPSKDAVLGLAPILKEAAKKMGAAYTIAEQVCVVGEPVH